MDKCWFVIGFNNIHFSLYTVIKIIGPLTPVLFSILLAIHTIKCRKIHTATQNLFKSRSQTIPDVILNNSTLIALSFTEFRHKYSVNSDALRAKVTGSRFE